MQNVLPRSGARAYTLSDYASADQRYYHDFAGLTLSFSIRFAPASNSDVVKRFSAVMFMYFIITFVVILLVLLE